MKLASLFSGGKDSTYATYLAMSYHEVSCLISLKSKNPESYMFHTPNISMTKLQADAIGIPLVEAGTEGKKETELKDLKRAIKKAMIEYKIEGVVTGAIESVYQATRIQKICHELNIWCFNPLWKKDQVMLLEELLKSRFEIIITAVAAYPLDERWLGRKIDSAAIAELKKLKEKFKVNPAGEGGEYESLVLNAPFFKKRLSVSSAEKIYRNNSGIYQIKEAR